MNSDTLKGQWKQLKGDVKKQWAKLTDDDLKQIEGHKDKLVGKIQERYGSTREDAERQADDWLDKQG
ncbi:MAG: general stress protein CsbD [Alcanivorax sp.]|nr:general stress protein CsbD [Alcanivorax sp.]MAY09959.1 general stress protein CsbD [Alcanivorax sp.]MBI53142.1 general stress protein CsbD [Alcanivorax sp.]MBU57292.1 general stress protein CsbD [Alcanivorax sp.]MCQ6261753.1 CsbD family protein [Alcanivorax sp. MM125-6]|tara:strand:+ start:32269 stop:32469 length:201 start_codon:yes stop_codon:yes gene_type:complete